MYVVNMIAVVSGSQRSGIRSVRLPVVDFSRLELKDERDVQT